MIPAAGTFKFLEVPLVTARFITFPYTQPVAVTVYRRLPIKNSSSGRLSVCDVFEPVL
jgi:hypothetical protein